MIHKNFWISFLCFFPGFFFFFPVVSAYVADSQDEAQIDFSDEFLSEELFPEWGNDSERSAGTLSEAETIRGVIGDNQDEKRVFQYLPRIIDLVLGVCSAIVVVMFVVIGVKLIIAGGDEEAVSEAKKYARYASIGSVFIIVSYTITKALYNFLSLG